MYEDDQRKSQETGSNAFLPKPVEAERLFDLLQRLLPVEWEYQKTPIETAEEEDAATCILPPIDILNMLRDYAEVGDVRGILDALKKLEQEDARLTPFATQLRQLAESFKMNKLRALLEEYAEHNDTL